MGNRRSSVAFFDFIYIFHASKPPINFACISLIGCYYGFVNGDSALATKTKGHNMPHSKQHLDACALGIIIILFISGHFTASYANGATTEEFISGIAVYPESIHVINSNNDKQDSSGGGANSRQGRDSGITVSESFYTTLKNSLGSLDDNSKIFLAGLGVILAFMLVILTLAFLV